MSDEFFVKLVSVPWNKIYSSIENGICLLFILRKSGNVAFCFREEGRGKWHAEIAVFNISSPTGPRPRPVEANGPLCVIWLQDNPHCPVVCKWLEPRSYSVRPWQHRIVALARKVNHIGWFLSFSRKDSTQLRFLSLPAKKTVWEWERIKRGREGNSWGHLDWTSSKTQRVVFFEKEAA